MLPDRLIAAKGSWDEMRDAFRWPQLSAFNIAEVACLRWARQAPDRVALRYLDGDDQIRDWTYGALEEASARLANLLADAGLRRGARVAVLLPQTPETVITHLAAYRMGAVVVPLFTLFGEDGLRFRLSDSGTEAVVTDGANLAKINAIRAALPDLKTVLSITGAAEGARDFWAELERAASGQTPVQTGPDDPAFISYTSGTTGPPKGALHGHRVLLGHLPGVELPHNFLPQPGDSLWTPADWAWMGGLTNIMLPALTYGVPLIAHRMTKFDPERAHWLMDYMGVRNTFLPPTALKLMRQTPPGTPPDLRSVASGGEALGAEMLDWGKEVLGQTINEFYGQTECNLVLANCAEVLSVRPGSTGRAVPGHDVAVIDEHGQPLGPDETGEIAIRRPDPSMFLRYWNKPEKTAEKFTGDWMRTGDVGRMDAEGYVYFASRDDDVITSSGYRIGPTEIEQCLTSHPAVTMAAVIGVPDPVRTETVKAFVIPKADVTAEALISHVRTRLSPHMSPREIEFVEDLPMTATGKIMRRALRERSGS